MKSSLIIHWMKRTTWISLALRQLFRAEIYLELDTGICAMTDFSFGVCLSNLTLFFGNIANVDNMSEPSRNSDVAVWGVAVNGGGFLWEAADKGNPSYTTYKNYKSGQIWHTGLLMNKRNDVDHFKEENLQLLNSYLTTGSEYSYSIKFATEKKEHTLYKVQCMYIHYIQLPCTWVMSSNRTRPNKCILVLTIMSQAPL